MDPTLEDEEVSEGIVLAILQVVATNNIPLTSNFFNSDIVCILRSFNLAIEFRKQIQVVIHLFLQFILPFILLFIIMVVVKFFTDPLNIISTLIPLV